MNIRSLLDIADLNSDQLFKIITSNADTKKKLKGKTIGCIYEKPSTRTRISFHVGITQLGGTSLEIKFDELNLSRQESFEDTFRALGCYLDGIVYRTTNHDNLTAAQKYSSLPIINALSDKSHPCQIISDLYTLNEKFNTLNLNILWVGDVNNVCFSLVEAANLIKNINLIICSPRELTDKISWRTNSNVYISYDFSKIDLSKINCVMTDVFISMNDQNDLSKIELLKNYCVTSDLMSRTKSDSVFMHCLPAKVGFEVSEEVFRSDKSIVWRQAYNRMVAQKKILQYIYQ